MATATNKVPPQLSKFKSYSDWVRMVNIWTKFTDLDVKKQGPALVMSLSGKALEAILELEDDILSSDSGVKRILEKLNTIYKKDELHEKFQDLENFESYKRSENSSIQEFLVEFDQRFNKLRRHQTTISEDLLGFKLLKSANLSDHHEQLIKATISCIDYENIKKKIKSIFSNECHLPSIESDIKVRVNPHSLLRMRHQTKRNMTTIKLNLTGHLTTPITHHQNSTNLISTDSSKLEPIIQNNQHQVLPH